MEQIIKLLDLVKAVAECYRHANSDGKITWIDIYKFQPAIDELVDFIESTQHINAFQSFDFRKITEVGKKLDEISVTLRGK